MKEFVVGLILLFAVTGHAYAQSTLTLQEKCASEARENFERKYCGDQSQIYPQGCFVMDLFGTYYWSYESHYNKKLDKCFLLAHGHTGYKFKPMFNDYSLFDVFDGRVYATFFARIGYEKSLLPYPDVAECGVGDKQCKSLEEFENLIHAYMKE
jgi:hypothetical protein